MIKSFVAATAAAVAFAAPSVAQVTSVTQLSDVEPVDWSYQAISNLIETYGCVAGYPNGTFKPDQAASRQEMAALVNACLDNITKFYTASDAALAAALQAEFGKEIAALDERVEELEVAQERREEGVGNYVGLGFTGYSADGSFSGDDYNSGATLTGRAKVWENSNNFAVSLRPELTFVDNGQTALGGALTVDFPLKRKELIDGSTVSAWNAYAGIGVGGAIGAADGSYNMYGEDVDGYGVIGTEVSLVKNFVGFANIKLPFGDNSVDNYAPVGTLGAGWKF